MTAMTLRRRSAAVAVAALVVTFTTTGSALAPTAATADAIPGPSCSEADGPSASARTDRTIVPAAEEEYVEEAYQRALARGEQALNGKGQRVGTVPLRIRVHVHVVQDSEAVGYVSDLTIAEQIAVLNDSYAGVANPSAGTGANTQVSFELASTDRTVNADWYPTSYYDQTAANAMKEALHQGGKRDLNLYLTDVSNGILGWATFPDEYAGNPQRDGVVVDNTTVPGGSSSVYNLGATATHEVGHWLGLFHTFQGGCGGGDLVADTPAESFEHYGCETGSDTCPAAGTDPVHNYMDYSDDSCMYEFTAGQGERVQDQTESYRNSAPTIPGANLTTFAQTAVSYTPVPADPEGDSVVVTLADSPAHGTATMSGGSVTYTPAAGFIGQDTFTLAATDAFGLAASPATVVVDVAALSTDHSVVLDVVAPRRQKVENLSVAAGCGGEGCSLSVTGTVTAKGVVHGKKKTKTFQLVVASGAAPAGGQATLHLSPKGVRKLKKLLHTGWRGTAKATVVATDAAGNSASSTSTVKLKS